MDKVKAAEDELKVAHILKKRGHGMSLFELHNNRSNSDIARALFLDLSSSTANKYALCVWYTRILFSV